MRTVLKAGRLRHKVAIEYESKTADGQGGNTLVWTLLDTVFAEVTPDAEGEESGTSSQVTPTLRHTVTIRYRTGVTPAMRLRFAGRVLRIRSVSNTDERNKELVLRCIETAGETR